MQSVKHNRIGTATTGKELLSNELVLEIDNITMLEAKTFNISKLSDNIISWSRLEPLLERFIENILRSLGDEFISRGFLEHLLIKILPVCREVDGFS